MKLVQKQEAIQLRKKGKSIREISELVSVSKSSVSLWVRHVKLSKKAQAVLLQKTIDGRSASVATHRALTALKLHTARKEAEELLNRSTIDSNAKKILCAMLYWCEGAKSVNDRYLSFMNSDPALVSTYLQLLRDSFRVNEKKFRVLVHLHRYHNEERQLRFWSKITNIPLSQFARPYIKPDTGIRIREGYAGCASVRYHDVSLAREVQAIARETMRQYGSIS